MAQPSLNLEVMSKELHAINLDTLAKDYPEGSVKTNPLDFFRASIAEELSKAISIDKKLVFPALAYTSKLENGDLVIAAPRLRVKGGKPADQAKEWAEKVCFLCPFYFYT